LGDHRGTGIDNYWTIGTFEPGPAYQQYARLFDNERELRQREMTLAATAGDDARLAANEAWMDALEAINNLGLRFGGTNVRDFKTDARGVCEFKLGL